MYRSRRVSLLMALVVPSSSILRAMIVLLFLVAPSTVTAKTAGPHRYWRLISPGITKWGLVEVRWLDDSGSVVSTGGEAAAISSGAHASWCDATAAADSDQKSYWLESKQETEDRWIGVDLGATAEPVAVAAAEVMQVAHDNYRTFLVELQWSDDGTEWTYFKSGELDGVHRDQEGDGAPYWEKVPAPPRLDFEQQEADFF